MVKNNKDQIKPDEEKILSELMKNAKENMDTIAKNCGFSRQKVWRMMKQLEENHMIWGYSPVIDNQKENLEKFMLFIKRTEIHHDPKDIDEIIKNLLAPTKKELGVTMISSYRIHGEYDWVMIFTAQSIIHAKKFSEAIMQKFSGKQSIHISQVLFTVRENYIQNPKIREMMDFI
jgi:DNA-binding Lrp family transcriptional regulator